MPLHWDPSYDADRYFRDETPLPEPSCASCGGSMEELEGAIEERPRPGVPPEGEHDDWLGYVPGTIQVLVYTCPCCGRRQEFVLD